MDLFHTRTLTQREPAPSVIKNEHRSRTGIRSCQYKTGTPTFKSVGHSPYTRFEIESQTTDSFLKCSVPVLAIKESSMQGGECAEDQQR